MGHPNTKLRNNLLALAAKRTSPDYPRYRLRPVMHGISETRCVAPKIVSFVFSVHSDRSVLLGLRTRLPPPRIRLANRVWVLKVVWVVSRIRCQPRHFPEQLRE